VEVEAGARAAEVAATGDMFAQGVPDDDDALSSTQHASEGSPPPPRPRDPWTYLRSSPCVAALRQRIPLVRAQLIGLLQELDDFNNSFPPDEERG
jgi:hypothetical protein